MIKEFKDFLLKQNAIALAIGVIIGAAIGKVVAAIADDVINPIIGLLLPAGDWRNAKIVLSHAVDSAGKVTENAISYGDLIGRVVDFVIIALVVYLIAKAFLPKPGPATTKECTECKETIPIAAKRCKACAQPQPAAP
ncbi:MAG: large conductance mechanosensitive channel protein MscL [Thermoanaerobaculia bacterium]